MKTSGAQTFAVGFCWDPPDKRHMHMHPHATDLKNSFIIGYDLPRVYINGQEVGKVPTAEWRPLRAVQTGDKIGLLVAMVAHGKYQLVVFQNGVIWANFAKF